MASESFFDGSISIGEKSSACLAYTFAAAKPYSKCFSNTLLVFLNGLVLPRDPWRDVMTDILTLCDADDLACPAMLSYDRYGQGESDDDPSDGDEGKASGYGHDIRVVVKDLNKVMLKVASCHMGRDKIEKICEDLDIIFVGKSIGCAIARLYAQEYPGRVVGAIFLDSILANSDYQEIFPDPDSSGFDPNQLPEDITPEELRETRRKFREMFHPSVTNNERFDRRNLPDLLPESNKPKLRGKSEQGPWLTVIGHDWETFAEQSEKGSMKTPRAITMNYTNPYWQRYNEGLAKLTKEGRGRESLIADGCGHFIQHDNPKCVAKEVVEIVQKLWVEGT